MKVCIIMLGISKGRVRVFFLLVALIAMVSQANAELVIEGTRVIYNGANREAAVTVSNFGEKVALVQSRITNDQNKDDLDVPFVIIEPLIKIEPQRRHQIRMIYSGAGLPLDRESMFFLNVMEIPIKSGKQNSVQFAVQQRLKLFFRPKGMKGSVSDAVASLHWKRLQDRVEVINPSRLHVSLMDIAFQTAAGTVPGLDYLFLKPGERKYIDFKVLSGIDNVKVEFAEINDVGLQVPHVAKLFSK